MANRTARYCKSATASGEPCGAFVRVGSDFCAAHDPEFRDRMAEGRRRGGIATSQKSAKVVLCKSDFTGSKVEDVGGLIAETINQVRTGQVDVRIANTVGYLSNVLLRVLEVNDLEKRLIGLEEAIARIEAKPC